MSRAKLILGASLGALLVVAAIHVTLVLSAAPMDPLRRDPLSTDASEAPVDEDLATARIYAPWILHETSLRWGRQDIPAAMDFDGDRDATDNWEEMARFELVPTVYYTLVETRTHIFLTYHLYHPRDWSRFEVGLSEAHEGDGENIQVVVEKANASVVALTTQAHYDAWSYAPQPGPILSRNETLRGDFEIVQGHPVVYVESGGHGIYGSHDPRAANRLARVGDPVVTFSPAEDDEAPAEPQPPWNASAKYRLVSLPAFLANSTDHPTLFAKPVEFEGHSTPRYHRGDRYAGPAGPDRGISPFALGFGWSRGEIGSLFWDPAARYQEALSIRGAWAIEYVAHPFAAHSQLSGGTLT